jgi:hypothetical protein
MTDPDRRRRRRNIAVLAAVVVVVAGAGAGVGLLVHQRSERARPTAASPGSASATSGNPSATASPSPSRPRAPAEVLGLPRGGRVPAEFRAVAVTTTARGITYLLGYASCRAPSCTTVLRYDGSRWRGLAAPVMAVDAAAPSSRPDTVRDVRFGTPRDGWAYGGALWSTHDGARRWHRVDAGGAVVDLASDGTTTYAVVVRCAGSAGGCRARLRSTPVSRDDWRDVPGVAAYGSSAVLSVSGDTAAVSFLDTTEAYVRRGGGWHSFPTGCTDSAPRIVAAASSPRLFAFCDLPGAGNVEYTIQYSDDGLEWTGIPRGADRLRLPDGRFVSFTAASSTLLVAASGGPSAGGAVMVSRDGGRTWSRASGRGGLPDLDAPQDGGWRYVGASSGTRVVALAAVPHPGYWVSHDGARTWAEIAPG